MNVLYDCDGAVNITTLLDGKRSCIKNDESISHPLIPELKFVTSDTAGDKT